MGILSQLALDLCVSFLRSNQALLSLFFFFFGGLKGFLQYEAVLL